MKDSTFEARYAADMQTAVYTLLERKAEKAFGEFMEANRCEPSGSAVLGFVHRVSRDQVRVDRAMNALYRVLLSD